MYGWRPYKSVAKRRAESQKTIEKLAKKGQTLKPICIEGRKIATNFWGKSWCSHIESFSDYNTRLPRGRSYVRNGSVIDLAVSKGAIAALVQGSELYKVQITIKAVEERKWQDILKKCSGEIASVIELLQGKLSSAVMATITDQQTGLFPLPQEIALNCSCPDWANMCKHVAAALYGIGARLDLEPELLFVLRTVDHMELLKTAKIDTSATISTQVRIVEDQDLSALFGIDIALAPTKGLDNEVSIKTKAIVKNAKKKGHKKFVRT